jgi:hypothetical protein
MTGTLERRLSRLEGAAGRPHLTHEEWLDILNTPGQERSPELRERMRRSGEIHHDWLERLK